MWMRRLLGLSALMLLVGALVFLMPPSFEPGRAGAEAMATCPECGTVLDVLRPAGRPGTEP